MEMRPMCSGRSIWRDPSRSANWRTDGPRSMVSVLTTAAARSAVANASVRITILTDGCIRTMDHRVSAGLFVSNDHQQSAGLDRLAVAHGDLGHAAITARLELVFHLHGFDNRQRL